MVIGETQREANLFRALEHKQFLWRTLPSLVRESSMTEAEVVYTLWKHKDYVIEGRSSGGEPVWALSDRYWKEGGPQRFLHMISGNMSTST